MNSEELQGLVPILPFNKSDNVLPEAVESDHAPLIVTGGTEVKIMAENISNPAHHHYFGSGEGHPFKHTHMNVPQPFDSNGVLEPSLDRKIQNQLNRIVRCMKTGGTDAYVIVEGYKSFYEALALQLYGHRMLGDSFESAEQCKFRIVVPPMSKDFRNKVGIVIREATLVKQFTEVISEQYIEGDVPKELNLTVLGGCHDYALKYIMIVGVHVSGCASQFPKAGLLLLADKLLKLHRQYPAYDILVLGDFNTTPDHVDETVMQQLHAAGAAAKRLPSTYFTHANPNCQGGVYDHALSIYADAYQLVPVDRLPEAGRALAEAIATSAAKYKRQKID